ncbi:MAG TPA: nuclear transport factor 2 family protein [Pyrinomonadaceae bacterium]|nr:nuclear transport factor 2 family protein [Pyrinomonadaceae bacterium]
MKSFFLLVVFTAAVPLLVYGQTDPGAQTKPTPSVSQQSGAVEQALIKLDRELMDAAVSKDKAVFERVASDHYVFVNPGGGVQERGAPADGPILESIQTENVMVRVDGDTAVLTGKAMVKGKFANGTDVSGPYTYMRVFAKQKGQWRVAAASVVPIMQPKQTPTAAPSPTP